MTRFMSVLLMIVMVTIAGCAATNQAQHHAESQPQEVLGTMAIGINPIDLASLPEPPIDLMLHIRQLKGGHDVIYDIADGTAIWELFTGGPKDVGVCFQNFRLVLPPGDYFVAGLDVRAKSLSDKPFFLPTGGPSFTVPKGGCVYIGRINATYLRLPPGSLDQANATTGKISAATDKPRLMLYLTKGALLPTAIFVDQPTEDECTPAGVYSKQLLAYAHHNVCECRPTEQGSSGKSRNLPQTNKINGVRAEQLPIWNIDFPKDEAWDVAYTERKGGTQIIEYTAGGEKVESWSQLVTFIYMPLPKEAFQDAVQFMLSRIATGCSSFKSQILAKSEYMVAFRWAGEGCGGLPPQEEIIRYEYVDAGLVLLKYTYYKQKAKPDFEAWVRRVIEAKVMQRIQ